MPRINLPKIEEKVLADWQAKKIFQKSVDRPAPRGDFVFFEGPPTANGQPGIHHVLARAFKDLLPRFKTMQGYRVVRKAGWDTHGLPVELEVEKKLGLKNKLQIEEYGIEKFNAEAKKSVWKYQEEWEQLTARIGFWLDMDRPYITYDNNYIETLWWIIRQWWDKDLLYQGHKVVPQCPRCGTALSSHEVAQGYKTIKEPSVYVKFKIKDESVLRFGDSGEHTPMYLIAWTTTPWTLPGNVALAVGEKIDYIVVRHGEEYLIMAKDLAHEVMGDDFETVDSIKGEDLLGVAYEPLFNALVDTEGQKYVVVPAGFVSTVDGTGIVHTAVMYGEDDYRLGEEQGLPKVHTVCPDGTFNERVDKWQGRFVKDAEADITQNLQDRGLLLKTVDYEHEYPFCWRCGTPLLYYAKDSWFVAVSRLKEQLLANNEQINWVPSHIKDGRFGDWLKDVKDWAFSRERYWGTPLPVWRCQTEHDYITHNKAPINSKSQILNAKVDCNNIIAIGSFEELEKISGQKLKDYHRPFVDDVTFNCDQCGGEMRRVEDVCDVWFDSGAMPLAQYHYPFENKSLIDCDDETLQPALRRRLRQGEQAQGDSLKGCQFPADYICEAVDQTRGWFYTLLAVSTMLGKGAPYKNVISLGHILDKHGKKMSKSLGNVVDPWEMLDKYGADVIRWYFYTLSSPGEPKRFDEQALKESSRVFITLLNVVSFFDLFAQDIPYEPATEDDLSNVLDLWITARLNELTNKVTANLESYDIISAARPIEEFVNELSTWYIRRSRDRFKSAKLEVKMPAVRVLRRTLFYLTRLMAPFTPFIVDYINIDSLKASDYESVHLAEWPKPNFEKQVEQSNVLNKMKLVRQIVELGLAKRDEVKIPVRQPLNKFSISNFQFSLEEEYLELVRDELNVKEVVLSPAQDKEVGEISVELDTEITEELRLEGLKRDLIRHINNLRKQQGLQITDKVKLAVSTGSEDIKKVLELYKDDILQATIAAEFIEDKAGEEVKISGEIVRLKLNS